MKNLKGFANSFVAQIVRAAFPLAKLYWFVFRPKTFGVKCVIRYGDEALLIRNTYGKGQWTFPGGGIRRGETPDQAVRREILEEVGIKIGKPESIGQFYTTHEYKRDTVHCFVAGAKDKSHSHDPKEIKEVRWFLISSLPELSPYAKQVLNLYKKNG